MRNDEKIKIFTLRLYKKFIGLRYSNLAITDPLENEGRDSRKIPLFKLVSTSQMWVFGVIVLKYTKTIFINREE